METTHCEFYSYCFKLWNTEILTGAVQLATQQMQVS